MRRFNSASGSRRARLSSNATREPFCDCASLVATPSPLLASASRANDFAGRVRIQMTIVSYTVWKADATRANACARRRSPSRSRRAFDGRRSSKTQRYVALCRVRRRAVVPEPEQRRLREERPPRGNHSRQPGHQRAAEKKLFAKACGERVAQQFSHECARRNQRRPSHRRPTIHRRENSERRWRAERTRRSLTRTRTP